MRITVHTVGELRRALSLLHDHTPITHADRSTVVLDIAEMDVCITDVTDDDEEEL